MKKEQKENKGKDVVKLSLELEIMELESKLAPFPCSNGAGGSGHYEGDPTLLAGAEC